MSRDAGDPVVPNDPSRAGRWICIDGVDGSGKTTLTRGLAELFQIEVAPEFSEAHFGVALRRSVRTSPHYISQSRVAQSLVFLGDFFEVHAAHVAPCLRAGISVVSDRGFLSKYAYQEIILSETLGIAQAQRLLDAAFAHVAPPDLTIWLTVPNHRLKGRLLDRDGHCDEARIDFLVRAERSAVGRLDRNPALPAITIDGDRPESDVLAEAATAVRNVLNYSS